MKRKFDSPSSAALIHNLIGQIKVEEDVFDYVKRMGQTKDEFDHELYKKIVGCANPFKEGDKIVNVAARSEEDRMKAKILLSNTKIKKIHEHPFFEDKFYELIQEAVDIHQYKKVKNWTLGELKAFLLTKSESEIKNVMGGLGSDIIGTVVKLMANDELIRIGQKVFNPVPNGNIGSKGYLSARVQPNSPTDHPDDIRWQVFNAFSFAVGDLMLGNNPADSTVQSVATTEKTLKDIIETFGLKDVLPWCVLSHIYVQNEVEEEETGSTCLWFQSIAGTEGANKTFDLSLKKMIDLAEKRTGPYGLYLETGQGADFTNGHGNGFDMVNHESRKYGFARYLMKKMAKVKKDGRPWMVVNDVAGFIGPEVFRNKEQLVRVGLEDIVMGKLHGLTIGMDICSTLHMDVSLEDLDWSVDQLMMANPGFLMALPTKNDPMLSYLTTAFQDHVRIREKFGYKIEDKMWEFFKKLGVLDEKGSPTKHFGDPAWVYYQYRRLKGDERSEAEIYVEARKKIEEVNHRGVPLAVGNGVHIWDLNPELGEEINSLYEDAKKNIWESFDSDFIKAIPYSLCLETKSINRTEYIVQPSSGEKLTSESVKKIKSLRNDRNKEVKIDVQVVVSDGLNANALMDVGHLDVYLDELKMYLKKRGFLMAPEVIVLINGRVRAGYRLGEFLFGSPTDSNPRSVIHLIGERPGTGHHNFSAYIAAPSGKNWNKKGFADHDIVKVVTGMSDTSLDPVIGAHETVDLLEEIILKKIGS